MTAGTATQGTDSLVIPSSAGLSAPEGTITLLAEDNESAAPGSTISAHGNVVIHGDYNNDNPGAGTYLDILGTILAPLVTLSGSPSANNVFTYASSDSTPGAIDAGSGNDIVNIEGLGAPTTVFGGTGNDTVSVGSLAPARGGSLSPMGALLTVNGGSGTDTLNVDDSGSSANRTGTLTSSALTGLGMTGGIDYSNIAALNIYLGSGTDTLSIASTDPGSTTIYAGTTADTIDVQSISGPTTIDGGAGNLTTNVGSKEPASGGVLATISAALVVNGGSGVNSLVADDSGSTGSETGTLTSDTITGLGMASGITYNGMASVSAFLGQGTVQFNIASTHTGTTFVQAGNSADTIDIGSTLGATTVTGGSGADTINVISTGAATTLNAGSGAALINIESTGGVTTVNSDRAVTTVNIQSIGGATTVNGDGQDVINVGSKAPQSGGDLSGISALLAIVGASGMDILNVDATGSTLQEDVTLTSSSLTGLDMSDGITYTNLAALDLSLGDGGDEVTVLGTGPGSTQINAGAGTNSFDIQATEGNLLVTGGAGSDAFVVGGTSAAAARSTKSINGALMLEGGTGTNSITVTADVDFTLTNQSLQLSNGETIGLSGIGQAILTGGTTDNTFDVSEWAGSATLTGGGGLDTIVSAVDASAELTNALLTRSNGASFALSGIRSAILSGGAGNETLDSTGFSGTAWLYGGSGADTLLAGSGNDYLDGGTGNDSHGRRRRYIDILNNGRKATGRQADTLIAGSPGGRR